MSTSSLPQFKALIFDVYGTLVDWETGIYDALQPLLAETRTTWNKLDALTAFGAVETDLQAKNPRMLYADVLAAAYDELGRRLKGKTSAPEPSGPSIAAVEGTGASSSSTTTAVGSSNAASSKPESPTSAARTFASSLARWPIFPDTIAALAQLKALGLRLVVLSNVDSASFAHTRAQLEQGFTFDDVLTAEEIGSYKPDPANFKYAIERLALPPSQLLCVAQSLYHDHVPARSLGLASAWICREGAYMGLSGDGVPESPDAKQAFPSAGVFPTLGAFADAMTSARHDGSA